MTIAAGAGRTWKQWGSIPARMSAEDDLFAELLGGLSKPFEITRKKSYDFAMLNEGIEKSISDFTAALEETLKNGPKPVTHNTDVLATLNRPLIIQVKGQGAVDSSVVAMLSELQDRFRKMGRSFVAYPAHESLRSLGGALARDLRSALKLTGVVPPHTIDSEVTESFCRATRELFDIQLKTPVRFVGAAVRVPGVMHEACHTGSIDLEGASVMVSAMVTLPDRVIPELMKRMTGLPQVPEELIRNGPAEFANVIGGAARGNLNSVGYELRSPTIPKMYGPEAQHILSAADASTSVVIRLETELGEGYLEIRFFS